MSLKHDQHPIVIMVTPATVLNNLTTEHPPLLEDTSSDTTDTTLYKLVGLSLVLAFLDLITILGNLLVCITVFSFRYLRTTTNYLILSLAFSDLLLGILVLPFSTLNTIVREWPLGSIFCNIYISTDVMLCTVSILNLFAISLERYLAVTKPLVYTRLLVFRRVMWIIGVIWLFSFLMGFVPILAGWNTHDGHIQNMANPSVCVFEGNKIYVLLVAVGTYFAPLIVMCAVYIRVFIIARGQVRQINQLVRQTVRMFNKDSKSRDPRLASDSKATVTLASVVTAFAICWVPYFVLFTIKPFISFTIDPNLDLFVLWLGYINSMLNPFLYGFHNTEFRDAFMKILCRKSAYNRRRQYV